MNWTKEEPSYEVELGIVDGMKLFNRFWMPLVIGVGLAGNAASLAVFQATKLRQFALLLHITSQLRAD